MQELTAAILTLAWVMTEGKGYWGSEECRKVTNEAGEVELWDKKRVVVNRFRQFLGTIRKDFRDPAPVVLASESVRKASAEDEEDDVPRRGRGRGRGKAEAETGETLES